MHNKAISCVKLNDLLKLCRFKFGFFHMLPSLKNVWSTLNTCGLKVSIS